MPPAQAPLNDDTFEKYIGTALKKEHFLPV